MENREVSEDGQITLPCFGTYDEQNYACNTACRRAVKCKEETLSRDHVEPSAKEMAEEAPIDVGMIDQIGQEPPETELLQTVVAQEQEASEPPEPERVAEQAVVSKKPVKTPVKVKVARKRKPSKKGLYRELLRSGERYTANDLIQAAVDKGFIQDTDTARKKARSFLHMCISEFKKKDKISIQRDEEGKYYNADAETVTETGGETEGE